MVSHLEQLYSIFPHHKSCFNLTLHVTSFDVPTYLVLGSLQDAAPSTEKMEDEVELGSTLVKPGGLTIMTPLDDMARPPPSLPR